MHDDRAVPQPSSNAGIASAESGLVVLDGPDGVAITLTAEAAALTGKSLIDAAEKAALQVKMEPGDRPAGLC